MTKQYVYFLSVLAVTMASNAAAFADALSVEVGKGVQFSDSGAVLIKYTRTKFEYHVGMWDGDNRNTAIGVGYPLEWQGKLPISWTPGLAMVSKETEILGTHLQFYNHFRLQYSHGEQLQFDVGWIHYSNGSRVFNHGYTPNLGENFIVLGLSYDY